MVNFRQKACCQGVDTVGRQRYSEVVEIRVHGQVKPLSVALVGQKISFAIVNWSTAEIVQHEENFVSVARNGTFYGRDKHSRHVVVSCPVQRHGTVLPTELERGRVNYILSEPLPPFRRVDYKVDIYTS